jgi:hypothetical protein
MAAANDAADSDGPDVAVDTEIIAVIMTITDVMLWKMYSFVFEGEITDGRYNCVRGKHV